MTEPRERVLVTLAGPDRLGITAELTGIIADSTLRRPAQHGRSTTTRQHGPRAHRSGQDDGDDQDDDGG